MKKNKKILFIILILSLLSIGANKPMTWDSVDNREELQYPLSVDSGGTGNSTGTATINANLTGPITSVGNATSVASQTGTGTKFVMDTSPTFTGTVTIPTPFTLGVVSVLPTGTELNYVDGVTSAIQTQLDGKVTSVGASSPLSSSGGTTPQITLAGLAGLGTANYFVGVNSGADGWEFKNIAGTANQITATHAVNLLTLSTPQDIATTSTPQFAKMGLGAAASASAIHYINSNAGGTNALWINAGSSNTSPAIQVDAAAGRVMFVNKTGGGETIFYLVQNDTYNNKFLECLGGGETPTLFEVLGTGNIWTVGDCSALIFTDRTPYPKTLQEAYDAVLSIEGINGKVNHEKLTSFVKSVQVKTKYNELTKQNENIGTETGRNLSATVSAQNYVIKDLITRITALENK